MDAYWVELLGILITLGLLIFLAFRGFTLLLAAPAAAIVAAAFSGEPLLRKWTLTFMQGTGGFIINFFPLFLLGGVFGKLMDDSGAALSIARGITDRLGEKRAVIAVVLGLCGAHLWRCQPLCRGLRRVPGGGRAVPAGCSRASADPTGDHTSRFYLHDDGSPRYPGHSERHPNGVSSAPLCLRRPMLGILATAIILDFGLWWLRLTETRARQCWRGLQGGNIDNNQMINSCASVLGTPTISSTLPNFSVAIAARRCPTFAPVVGANPRSCYSLNLLISLFVLPRIYTGYLAEPRFGETTLSAVSGVWSVVTALTIASLVLAVLHHKRLPELRKTLDAGANASILPVLNTASLVGFGAVVAALPAFAVVRDEFLAVPGGPLVSLAVAANVMGAITGSASGGLTITLNSLGETYAQLAASMGIHPELMHRISAAISSGALAMLPHNGAVVTLLAICGASQRESYRGIHGG